ncbi:MAG: hypothetical protein HZB38_04795 [Planctomycetes bacterium]|nr:hypothetical protein [Planctomycetota bacterium]
MVVTLFGIGDPKYATATATQAPTTKAAIVNHEQPDQIADQPHSPRNHGEVNRRADQQHGERRFHADRRPAGNPRINDEKGRRKHGSGPAGDPIRRQRQQQCRRDRQRRADDDRRVLHRQAGPHAGRQDDRPKRRAGAKHRTFIWIEPIAMIGGEVFRVAEEESAVVDEMARGVLANHREMHCGADEAPGRDSHVGCHQRLANPAGPNARRVGFAA